MVIILDKNLILKLLCKKDAVDLDDSIYNLRDITEELRNIIMLSLDMDEDFVLRNKRRLTSIYNILSPLADKLHDDNYIKGYTNSKKHLEKYIKDICIHITKIILSMDNLDIKNFTYHTNMLIDLVLIGRVDRFV